MNATEAHTMRQAARNKPQLTAQIVPSPFSLGVDATAKRLISEGYLGDIVAINVVSHNGQFADRTGDLGWRHNVVFIICKNSFNHTRMIRLTGNNCVFRL